MAESCREHCPFFQIARAQDRYLGLTDKATTQRYFRLLDVVGSVDEDKLEATSEEGFEYIRAKIEAAGPNVARTSEGISIGRALLKDLIADMERGCPGSVLEQTEQGTEATCPSIPLVVARKLLTTQMLLEEGISQNLD